MSKMGRPKGRMSDHYNCPTCGAYCKMTYRKKYGGYCKICNGNNTIVKNYAKHTPKERQQSLRKKAAELMKGVAIVPVLDEYGKKSDAAFMARQIRHKMVDRLLIEAKKILKENI